MPSHGGYLWGKLGADTEQRRALGLPPLFPTPGGGRWPQTGRPGQLQPSPFGQTCDPEDGMRKL